MTSDPGLTFLVAVVTIAFLLLALKLIYSNLQLRREREAEHRCAYG